MPAKGSGAGRTKYSPQLVIRLSQAEANEIMMRASQVGMTPSEYARRRCLAGWLDASGTIVSMPSPTPIQA